MKANKNIVNKTRRAALLALMPLMLVACKSRDKKIAETTREIDRITMEIENTNRARDNAVRDSANNNTMYTFLCQWIDEEAACMDSLHARNCELADSIQIKRINRAARQYPLSALLSKKEIRAISKQLQEYHSEWNENCAKNIIAGRGTLLDLYAICFDLDYSLFEPSFYIANEAGNIRFGDWRDKICIAFESEKQQLEQEEILNTMRKHAHQKEFARNAKEIEGYEHRCGLADSVYMEIENHFTRKYQPRLDSLDNARLALMQHKARLIKENLIKRR